jgi:flagellar L-ring protein precursor FlgH
MAYPQGIRQNSSYSLFSDNKASKIGDAITIIVTESSQASNNAETSTGRESNIGYGLSGGVGSSTLPEVDFGLQSNNDFKGSGSTKTTGLIKTKISATIDSVLNNGNLLIKGSRKIVINGEEQTIFIKGIVRTSDINADNSVQSYNISEAEIVFDGDGSIKDAQKPGWLTKVFHWIF